MRNIAIIAERELGSYLRTPSGYAIAAVALLLNALQLNALAIGDGRRLSAEVLRIFLGNAAFVVEGAAVLLSMRLLAEERSSGAQTLLFTAPIREGEIVLGKFLAALALLSLIILLSLYLPALIFVHGKVSIGHIAAGYVGLFCVGSLTLAIGTLVSSLAPHPFLAVIGTATGVGLLELSFFVSDVTEGTLARLVASFAPVFGHYPSFRDGILQLSDLVFFASGTYLLVLAAVRVLHSQRWR